ncbi:MAG: glycosyltransferase family 4 protein [Anaerolineae bacterium]|nr:glycosyltransferase family 4 protein [Anaerolineae bacterium]
MPIYVDVSAAVHSKAGLGRYAASLARALVEARPGAFALFYNGRPPAQALRALPPVPARSVPAGYKPWRMAVWWGQVLRVSFNRLVPGATLFHATEHLLPPLRDVPTVLTVHDLIFYLFPQYHKPLNYWYLRWTMPLYVRRADAVIAVSEATRQDLVRHYRVPPEKVRVIHEAAAPHFRPAAPEAVAQVRRRYGLPPRFALTVGTIEPRKNLPRLFRALAPLRGAERIPLVVAGGKGWLYEETFRTVARLGLEDQVSFLGYVPEEDLPALYTAADLFVLPSLYEGFGLPVLEAMSCGAPVACSQAASLQEVAGDAARYFDPHDPEAMAEAIWALWADADLRAHLREQGLRRAAAFSWERAAHETLALYDALLAGGR